MTQKVHVEVSYGYDRVYPDDVNLSDVVDDITHAERTYGHVSAQVNVSLVEPEPGKTALPTAVGSVVKEVYDDVSEHEEPLQLPTEPGSSVTTTIYGDTRILQLTTRGWHHTNGHRAFAFESGSAHGEAQFAVLYDAGEAGK